MYNTTDWSLKMKNILNPILLASVFAAFTANAEETIKLEDNSAILGKWTMYAETAALHKAKKEVTNDWKFANDGFLYVTSRDPRLGAKKEIKVSYTIEDGNIVKQFQPGRQKFETCKVVKLDKKDMTLHCKFNYYLFRR